MIEPNFSSAGNFSEGIAEVGIQDYKVAPGHRFLSANGQFVATETFRRNTSFSGGIALIGLESGKSQLVRSDGKAEYLDAEPFWEGHCSEDIFFAYKDRSICLLDGRGKIIRTLPNDIQAVGYYSNGVAPCQKNGLWGYINHTGEMVIEPKFSIAGQFSQGYAVVKLAAHDRKARASCDDDLWQLIDTTGCEQFEIKASFLDGFSEGFAKFVRNGKCGFIDRSGHVVIEPIYYNCLAFSEGLAACSRLNEVTRNYEWGYIDRFGKTAIAFKFLAPLKGIVRFPGCFKQGLAKMWTEVEEGRLRWGYIAKDGTWLILPKFYDVKDFSEGLAAVSVAGRKLR